MIHVVPVPASLDDRSLDALAQALQVGPLPRSGYSSCPGHDVGFPYGLTSLLTLGQAMKELNAPTPRLAVPDSDETRSYWTRIGFSHHAAEYFDLVGKVPKRPGEAPSTSWCRSPPFGPPPTSMRSWAESKKGPPES